MGSDVAVAQPPGPNVPPPPGPVAVLRPAAYTIQVVAQRAAGGGRWARVHGRSGVIDTVHVRGGAKERFVRLRVTAPSATKLPELDELTAPG
jgi:hypothetical protein